MKPHRISGAFKYVSPSEIAAATAHSLMPMPSHPPDPGIPVIWVAWSHDDMQYLVNDSGETLPSIVVDTAGFETTEAGMVGNEGQGIRYENVQPGEAVTIDTFDPMEDGVVVVDVCIESPAWGCLDVRLVRKGNRQSRNLVVLWDTGEAGRHAQVRWNSAHS